MEPQSEQPAESPASTERYLAAILDELTTIRRQLVQEPEEPASGLRLVTEPALGQQAQR